jgi:hypothetical protein
MKRKCSVRHVTKIVSIPGTWPLFGFGSTHTLWVASIARVYLPHRGRKEQNQEGRWGVGGGGQCWEGAESLGFFQYSLYESHALQMKGRWGSNINVWFWSICIPRNETARSRYFQNRIIMFCLPISTIMYLWAIYIFPGSVCLYIAAAK